MKLIYHFNGTHNFVLTGVVLMMYSTRESRFYAPILLAIPGLHSLEKYGQLPLTKLEEGKKFILNVIRGVVNGRLQPAFIERENELAQRRLLNGRTLDEIENEYLTKLNNESGHVFEKISHEKAKSFFEPAVVLC